MSKRILAFLMAAAMTLSMAACGNQAEAETPAAPSAPAETPAAPSTPSAPAETPAAPVEKTVAEMTKEERIEAMKNEPMYDETVVYWYGGGNCTSAPYIAQALGMYDEYGIKAEVLSGAAIKESLGTNAAQIGVSHIASLLVPITNGVNYSFVAGAHVGCQSLFVLADSPYQTTADLIGKKISVPNGIGNSSYNITARWLDADGIDPLKDVEMIQVETDACIASMESGEIAAVCTGDTWGYDMVKEGKLRVIRSLIDPDFVVEPCCVVAMNNDFIEENPVMATVMTECIKDASVWMRENPEEAVQMLLDVNQLSGSFEKNLELWNTLQFGLSDEVTGEALSRIIDDYIRLGLIPEGTTNKEDMLAAAWNPLASYMDDRMAGSAAAEEKPVDLTVSALTAEEIEAMKSEPQYEKGLTFLYGSGNCTSAPYIAKKLGLFDQYGIKSEQLKGVSTLEALGSNQAQVNINHIATMLVPCTNGVNYTFVGGAHVGCQSLFVLADSPYYTTEDLKGKAISAPNGIGNSSYNIMSRMFDHDGINPLTDVEITVVDTDACIVAMENEEIAGLVTSDVWAYNMVKEGKLRVIRSLMDEDFAQEPCCVIVMNNDFIKESPNMAKAVTECIKIASDWMRQNPEDAVQMLIDDKLLPDSISKEEHVQLWKTLQFGPSDAMAEEALKTIIDDYIRLDLLTATDDAAEVLAKAWNPLLPEADLGYDVNNFDGSWWDGIEDEPAAEAAPAVDTIWWD